MSFSHVVKEAAFPYVSVIPVSIRDVSKFTSPSKDMAVHKGDLVDCEAISKPLWSDYDNKVFREARPDNILFESST